MFKLIVFVLLLSPMVMSSDTYMGQLTKFYKGLESRQLLLRHQIKRAIAQMDNAKTQNKKEQIFEKNKSFFKYLLASVGTMKLDSPSKSFVRASLNELIDAKMVDSDSKSALSKRNLSKNENQSRKISETRSLKFKNPIKVSGHYNAQTPKIDRINSQDLFAFAGWALFVVVFGLWARSLFTKKPGANKNSGALQLKMFKDASTPVIFVNESEHIHWANTSAAKGLELTQGSSFYFAQELSQDEDGDLGHFQDDKGHRYLVERKSARLNGEKYQMLMFIKTSKATGPKNYRLVEKSLPMGASLSQALEKYHYLYAASGISVSVDQRTEDFAHTEKEVQSIDRIVYLAYQMAKDVTAPNIKFALESRKGRKALQVDIRGLKAESINMSQETFINQHEVGALGDLWNELEISLSGQEGRVFMFDKSSGSVPTFSIIVSFASVEAHAHSADHSGELGA